MSKRETYDAPAVEAYGTAGAVTQDRDKIGSRIDSETDTSNSNPLDGDFFQDS